MLADLLLSIRPVDVEILVDSWSKLVLNDRFLYWPRNLLDRDLRRLAAETKLTVDGLKKAGIRVTYTNPVDPFLVKFPNRNHKKLVLIDDRIAYVGGINFSEHNFYWHDMMLRIDDRDVSRFLRADFDQTSNGVNSSESRSFGDVELHTTDGRSNEGQFEKLFRIIEGAKERIHVHMPYVTVPFLDRLEETKRRGVDVTLIAPRHNNYILVSGSVRWRCVRSGLDLRLYYGRMTHLKAMLVDGEVLIMGSCNFDFFSYRHFHEILAVIRDRDLIADFKERVLRRDLESCHAAAGLVRSRTGRVEDLAVRSIEKVLKLTRNHPIDSPPD